MVGIETYLANRQKEVLSLLKDHPGQTVTTIAQLLSIDIPVAQLVVKPLLAGGKLDTTGRRKATKYFLREK